MSRALAWSAVVAAAALVVALGLQRIASVDYWWQLQTGADIAHHGVPRVETYSFTQPHAPRVEARWLYCLGLWALVQAGGPASATLAKTALGLCVFGLAARLGGRRMPSATAAAVVAIAALGSSQRLVVRPEMLTYAFLIVYVAIVLRLQAGRSRWAYALPALQALWTNVHGLFLLGPAILGAWCVAELVDGILRRDTPDPDRRRRVRTAAVLVAATLVTCALNPYGPRIVGLALGQFGALRGTSQKTFFTELRSPFAFTQSFTALLWYKVLIGVAFVSALVAWRQQRAFWVLLVASQFYLSATAVRNVPLFCVVAVPFVLRNLTAASLLRRPRLQRLAPAAATLVAVATLGLCLYQLYQLVTDRFTVRQYAVGGAGLGIAPHVFPEHAVDALDRSGVRGPLLCSETTGSYLIARGYKTFLDPRGDVYPDAFLERYRALATEPSSERLQSLVQEYGLQAALVELDVPRLVQFLLGEFGWRLVYLDSEAALFLRDGVAPEVPRLDLEAGGAAWYEAARRELPPPRAYATLGFWDRVTNPAPYDRLARACFERRLYAFARPLYEDARAAYPPGFAGWPQLGHMAAMVRDYPTAARDYDEALRRQPEDPELHWRAGLAALQMNEMDAALSHANAALRLAPDDGQKMALKGTVLLKRGQGAEAEVWLSRAIAKLPGEPSLQRNLAKAQYMQGHLDAAIASFETTCRLDPRDATAARDLARVLAQRGDKAAARDWLAKSLALDPRDPQALALRAQLEASAP